MGSKKNYGFNPQREHHSVILYEKKGKIGECVDFFYEDGCCGMRHYYWGAEEDYARSRRGEVEHSYTWDEENTEKLMLRTGTKNGRDLVQAIFKRFRDKSNEADSCIIRWCDEMGIKYVACVWY